MESEHQVEKCEGRFLRLEDRVRSVENVQAGHTLRIQECEARNLQSERFERSQLKHQWWMKGAAAAVIFMVSCMWWTVDRAMDKLIPAARIIFEYYDNTHPGIKLPKISDPEIRPTDETRRPVQDTGLPPSYETK